MADLSKIVGVMVELSLPKPYGTERRRCSGEGVRDRLKPEREGCFFPQQVAGSFLRLKEHIGEFMESKYIRDYSKGLSRAVTSVTQAQCLGEWWEPKGKGLQRRVSCVCSLGTAFVVGMKQCLAGMQHQYCVASCGPM